MWLDIFSWTANWLAWWLVWAYGCGWCDTAIFINMLGYLMTYLHLYIIHGLGLSRVVGGTVFSMIFFIQFIILGGHMNFIPFFRWWFRCDCQNFSKVNTHEILSTRFQWHPCCASLEPKHAPIYIDDCFESFEDWIRKQEWGSDLVPPPLWSILQFSVGKTQLNCFSGCQSCQTWKQHLTEQPWPCLPCRMKQSG